MNTMERIKKLKERRASQQTQGTGGLRNIFHQWKDGDNVVRFVDGFLEVRTHFIAPAPKRKDRGLCRQDAFGKGDDSLPQVINCLDWDPIAEKPTAEKTCPICKLAAIAKAIMQNNPTPEEQKFATELRQAAMARTNLKWNIIDRDDPYITLIDDGVEQRVHGYKIATIGMEAWKDIEGIFEQCNRDISDRKLGIDVKVTRGFNGTRTAYTAQAVLDGVSLKVTPLTPEEEAMPLHDLKIICTKLVDAQKIVDGLHEDLLELYQLNTEGGVEQKQEETETEEVVVDNVDEIPSDEDGLFDVPKPPVSASSAMSQKKT